VKDYGKVKTFRLRSEDEKKLDKCFELLNVEGDNFTVKMRDFIESTYDELKEKDRQIDNLHKRIDDLVNQIEGLKAEPRVTKTIEPRITISDEELVEDDKPERRGGKRTRKKNQSQPPKEPKTEPLKHTKPTQKGNVDDLLVCPDIDDWVHKSGECKKCGEETFKKFSDCFKERVKNPFNPIFTTSKPKPNL